MLALCLLGNLFSLLVGEGGTQKDDELLQFLNVLFLGIIFNVEAHHELGHQLALAVDLLALAATLLDLEFQLFQLLFECLDLLIGSLLLMRLLGKALSGSTDGVDRTRNDLDRLVDLVRLNDDFFSDVGGWIIVLQIGL